MRRTSSWRTASALGLTTAVTTALSLAAIVACGSNGDAGAPLAASQDASGTGTKIKPPSDAGVVVSGADAMASDFDAGGDQPAIDTLCAQAMQLGHGVQLIAEEGPEFGPVGGTLPLGTFTLGGLYSYTFEIDDAGTIIYVDGGGGTGDDGGGDDGDDGGYLMQEDASAGSGVTAGTEVEQKTLVLEASGLFSLASASGTLDAGLGATQVTAGVYQVSGDTLTLHATCPSDVTVTYSFSVTDSSIAFYEPGDVEEIFRQIALP